MSFSTFTLHGTTDSGGDATVDTPGPVHGRVVKVTVVGDDLDASANLDLNPIYFQVADGAAALGADLVNHEDVGTAAVTELYPSRAIQDNAGTSELFAAAGEVVPTHHIVDGQALRATIAAGGATKEFRVLVTLEQ